MIFTKLAFSIKIRNTFNFRSIFGSQSEENSNKNRFKSALFLNIAFSAFFLQFCFRFGSQKSLQNHSSIGLKKEMFGGSWRNSLDRRWVEKAKWFYLKVAGKIVSTGDGLKKCVTWKIVLVGRWLEMLFGTPSAPQPPITLAWPYIDNIAIRHNPPTSQFSQWRSREHQCQPEPVSPTCSSLLPMSCCSIKSGVSCSNPAWSNLV